MTEASDNRGAPRPLLELIAEHGAVESPDPAGAEGRPSDNLEAPECEEILRTLAGLPPLEYETQRQARAEKLGYRISVLDREVERAIAESW